MITRSMLTSASNSISSLICCHKIGWVNHPYFGGEQRFAEMVARAEKLTGRKAKLPEK